MCWHSSWQIAIAPSLTVLTLLSHRMQIHGWVRGASQGVTVLAEEVGPRQWRRVKLSYHWSDCRNWERAGREGLLGSLWLLGQCGEHGLKLGGNHGESPGCEQAGPHTWKAEEKLSPAPPLDTSFWTHQRAERREAPQRPCRKFVSLFLKSFWPWSICQSPSKCVWSLELG